MTWWTGIALHRIASHRIASHPHHIVLYCGSTSLCVPTDSSRISALIIPCLSISSLISFSSLTCIQPSKDEVGTVPSFNKVNRREIPQPQPVKKVAVTPSTHKESTDKQQQQQQQDDEQRTTTSTAAQTKSDTPSLTKPADENLSVPKLLTSVDDGDPPPQSPKDTPSNVGDTSQNNPGPTPSVDQPNPPLAESSGKRSKPAPSVAATPQPPPLLLNVAEVDGEGESEGSRTIGSMLKKLTVSVISARHLVIMTCHFVVSTAQTCLPVSMSEPL